MGHEIRLFIIKKNSGVVCEHIVNMYFFLSHFSNSDIHPAIVRSPSHFWWIDIGVIDSKMKLKMQT